MVNKRESISSIVEIRESQPSVFVDAVKRIGELALNQISRISDIVDELGKSLGVKDPTPKDNIDY